MLYGLTSGTCEVVATLAGCQHVEQGADGAPERVFDPRRSLPKERLQFGEDLLHQVQVPAVVGKMQQAAPCTADCLLEAYDFVAGRLSITTVRFPAVSPTAQDSDHPLLCGP